MVIANEPAGQLVHTDAVAAPENVPRPQEMQILAADAEYLPELHDRHASDEVAPGVAKYRPAANI